MTDVSLETVSGHRTHLLIHWFLVAFVLITVIVITYAGRHDFGTFQFNHVDVNGTLDVTSNTTVSSDLQVRGQIKGPVYKAVEEVSANNEITASEAGTVYLIQDAEHTSTLPTATTALIGSKFKFIVTDAAATNISISGNDANQCIYGYAVISKSSEASERFSQGTGGSNSKITLNGGSTGGVITGVLNVIEVTCVAAAVSDIDTDCWYAEAQLMGSGTLATPFAA